MTSLDLHPEELFDRAAQGLVTDEERARLDAHLAACAACRFEQRARGDFAAIGGDPGDLDDLVSRALSGVAASRAPEAATLGRRSRVAPLLVAAAALAGVGAFAAVAQYTGLLPRLLAPREEAPRTEPPRGSRRGAAAASPARTETVAPEMDVPAPSVGLPSPEAAAPSTAAEPVAVAGATPASEREGRLPAVGASAVFVGPSAAGAQPSPAVAAPSAASARTSPAVSGAAPTSVRSSPGTGEAPPAAMPEPDALALFTRARDARVRGDTVAALRDLRAVVARFPAAPEAALAHAELGRLLLDRGEPASALESFDAYLATPHHLLREDVEGARALALQALGRADAERAAWEAVLRDFPTGVYAPRARARLEALSP